MKSSNEIILSESLPQCKISYSFEADIDKLPVITSPAQAYQYLLNIWDLDTISYKEEFYVLLLNNSKRCTGWARISSGGRAATIVELAMVFQVALLANASALIVAHNHPSGTIEASVADIALTKRLVEIGKIIGIEVLDHIILTAYGYKSILS